ncbi:hypothetical protein ACFYNM_25155 [Streptomyces spororaveus]|uniref:hypothetical protein n=1 Tax=Streptomyces spororaveus TaxID=284039 RepID=UPI0036963420
MHVRSTPSMASKLATRSMTAAAAMLLASVPLTGCAAGEQGAKAEAVTRDTVDRDIRAAVRKAGLDPAKGKTTTVPNGIPHPSAVDWIAVLGTAEAEAALPRIGAELERRGWHAEPVGDVPLSYEKSDWILGGRSTNEPGLFTLAPGESVLNLSVTYFGR